ncbi:MAG: head GIN domain-containing protein [Burkholderiales bacterium]|jgi:hypothetical protein
MNSIMNKRHFLLAALLVALGAQANPEPVGKTYTPGPFDSLSFGGSAIVQFQQGDRDELFIEGDESVQKSVTVELRGTELVMRSEGNWKFWTNKQRIKMRIVMRDLKELRVSGVADFIANEPVSAKSLRVSISGAGVARFERLKAEELRFSVSGSGDGYFTGSVDELGISISGRGDFYGEHFAARNAKVSISGLGKARVWATGELNAGVSGIGTVDYWGAPNLQKRSSGIGKFNDKGAKAVSH